MEVWYYCEAGQQKGPVPKGDLIALFHSGTLPVDTLVWTESMKEWQKANTIQNLALRAAVPPPPVTMHNATAQPVPMNAATAAPAYQFVATGPQRRPWVRYWARMIDIIMFALVAGFFLGLVLPGLVEGVNDTLFGLFLVFAFVFVEPLLLSAWGTTPGKALLNIRLRKQDGTRPNYEQGFARAFNVWIRGLGLGIPLVALITQIVAYNRLAQDGITSWDRTGGFQVAHGMVGAGRIIAVIGIFIAFLFLTVLGELA